MVAEEQDDDASIATAFLVELVRDRSQGVERTLAEYQARYPGYESIVAREYGAFGELHDDERSPEVSGSSSAGGRYRVEAEIGRGGMGTVFRVWEHRLHRHLAMKRVSEAGTPQLARFLEEAKVTAQLHHPGIVPVHELGLDTEGRPYFTMDMVRGRTFAEVIECARTGADGWSLARALDVLQRVCEAVAYAHSKDVVHRDLKPQNVMVGRFGEVYVMDWGLARVSGRSAAVDPTDAAADGDCMVISSRAEPDTPQWTLQGDVVGTPAYMAPEQARGAPDVDRRADVYAIGAMLYHLLAGRMPYAAEGEQPSSRAILERVALGPPPPLSRLRPDAPAELVAVCEKAMARAAADRYADVSELREDLRAFLESRVVRAYESGTLAELRKWVRRNRALTAAASLAVLALSVGLVVSLVQTARARGETVRANASSDDAMAAVSSLLTVVGQHTLLSVPQADPTRRQPLRDAVTLFEKFLAERGDDPTVRRRVATASFGVAMVYERLGDRAEARAASRRALELWQGELQRDPQDRELRMFVCRVHNLIGTDEMRTGDYQRAESTYREALGVVDGLLAEQRDEVSLELGGLVNHNLAVLSRRTNELEAARQHVEAAIERAQELVDRFGGEHLPLLAAQHDLLGAILQRKFDRIGAQREHESAIEAYRRASASAPGDYELREGWASALSNLAVVQNDLRDPAAAVATVGEALVMRREIVAAFPRVPSYRSSLGLCLANLSVFLRGQRRFEESFTAAREAVTEHRTVLALDPENRVFVHNMLLARRAVHKSGRRLGRHVEMAANAHALGQLPGADPAWTRESAIDLAQCLPLVAADTSLQEAQRAARTEEYVSGILEILQGVAERGELVTEHLDHPDFAPLRERAEFQSLVQTVKAAGR